MPRFPIRIAGQQVDDLDALVGLVRQRAERQTRDNPAQMNAADGLLKSQQDPNAAEALAHACAALVADSDDPRVLELCAQLGGKGHAVYYAAVLDRLEGGGEGGQALPDSPGPAGTPIAEQLVQALITGELLAHPDLVARVHDLLQRQGRSRERVRLLSFADPHGQLADVLVAALGEDDATDGSPAGWFLGALMVARRQPDRLLDVAAGFARFPESARAQLVQRLGTAAPDWWASHGQAFRSAVGLD